MGAVKVPGHVYEILETRLARLEPTLVGVLSRIAIVVGQLIDYAANAVYWPIETLRASFDSRLEREGRDTDAELSAVLGPDADPEAYWEQAGANLKAGQIKLGSCSSRTRSRASFAESSSS